MASQLETSCLRMLVTRARILASSGHVGAVQCPDCFKLHRFLHTNQSTRQLMAETPTNDSREVLPSVARMRSGTPLSKPHLLLVNIKLKLCEIYIPCCSSLSADYVCLLVQATWVFPLSRVSFSQVLWALHVSDGLKPRAFTADIVFDDKSALVSKLKNASSYTHLPLTADLSSNNRSDPHHV